jgi:hypothetical protein
MAKITFNSETYNAFLAEKKCCIATQVSEYIDAMYSASSNADCLLDELRENIYYLKFLESAYIPVGDILYPENGSCNYTSVTDYTSFFNSGTKFTEYNYLYWYNENGLSQNLLVIFTNDTSGFYPPNSIHGGATQLQNGITNYFLNHGYSNVNIVVTYINGYLTIKADVDGIQFNYLNTDTFGVQNFTYSCDYVYASEDTNCITDDDAIKLSNLMHCDCCD